MAHRDHRAEGELRTLTLDVGAVQGEDASPSPRPTAARADIPVLPPTKPESPQRILGYVALGGGGIAVVAGLVTGIMVLSDVSTYKEHCLEEVCDAIGSSAASRGRTLGIVSPLLPAAGRWGHRARVVSFAEDTQHIGEYCTYLTRRSRGPLALRDILIMKRKSATVRMNEDASDTLYEHRPSQLQRVAVRDPSGRTAFDVYEPVYAPWPDSAPSPGANRDARRVAKTIRRDARDTRPGGGALLLPMLFVAVLALSIAVTALAIALVRLS